MKKKGSNKLPPFKPCTEIRPTDDRGTGLFATDKIEEDKLFYEYTGVVKTKVQWETDKVRYIANGNVTNYGVAIGSKVDGPKDYVVDGTEYGNYARFSNCSHFPNAVLEEVSIRASLDVN